MKSVLVTGGAGYIGSHTCLALLEAGYGVAVVDNLCNARRESLNRVEAITGKPVFFYPLDVRDRAGLSGVFAQHQIDAVIHFAGLKSVGESVEFPKKYYENNVYGTEVLCSAMAAAGVYNLVFSSSAAVYGAAGSDPITEDYPLAPHNPYGDSKRQVEANLSALGESEPRWNTISLRYFNPAGAHRSGLIGEDPRGIPDNLTPSITQVAIGKHPAVQVWGGDYPTPDGTGVRDYIHIMDLANGHVKAMEKLADNPGEIAVNLGTGRPYSVLEVLAAFEKAVGRPIPHEMRGRRAGDSACYYADPGLARKLLDWEAQLDIDAMASDAWRWQEMNPDGYPH